MTDDVTQISPLPSTTSPSTSPRHRCDRGQGLPAEGQSDGALQVLS